MTPTDWTQHDGSECPVAAGTLVEVMIEFAPGCEQLLTAQAVTLNWQHVTTYRVVSPAPVAERDAKDKRIAELEAACEGAEQRLGDAIDASKSEWAKHGATEIALGQWKVRAQTAESQITADKAEIARALGYATTFLMHYVYEHCNPVPEWAPLPDLMGVLLQIDNATTVTREFKARAEAAESQVAALKTERDATNDLLRRAFGDDTGALLSRAQTAESELAALKAERDGLVSALKHFADFAEYVDENGWTSSIHRDGISVWFGPSDFRNARSALEASKERT